MSQDDPNQIPEAEVVDTWDGEPEFDDADFDIPDLERPPELAMRISQSRFWGFAFVLVAVVCGIMTWAGRLSPLWWAVVAVAGIEAARRFRKAKRLTRQWPPQQDLPNSPL